MHAIKSSTAAVTLDDMKRLMESVIDLRTAIGRDIIHGRMNGDDTDVIVENILGDVAVLLVSNWAHNFFPEAFIQRSLDEPQFAHVDDPAMQEAYLNEGF